MPMAVQAHLAAREITSFRCSRLPHLVRRYTDIEGLLKLQREAQPTGECCYAMADPTLLRTPHRQSESETAT